MNDTSSILETLECFVLLLKKTDEDQELNNSLSGESNDRLKALLQRLSKYGLIQHFKDFRKISIDENKRLLYKIKQILLEFEVPKKQWGRFIGSNLTVYDFLLELRTLKQDWKEYPYYKSPLREKARILRQKFSKLDTFITSIEDNSLLSKKNIAIGSALALWIMSSASVFFVANSSMIMSLLSAISFFPITGLIGTIGAGIYTLYDNTSDKKIPFFQRMINNLISLGSTGLKVTAYAAVIVSATVMAPLVPIFFVVASIIDAIHEISRLIQISIRLKNKGQLNQDDPLDVQQQKIRFKCDYIKHRNEILIQAISAIIMTGIVIAAAFLPAIAIVTVLTSIAIGLVFVFQQLMLFFNKKHMETSLQKKFEALETSHDDMELEMKPILEKKPKVKPEKLCDETPKFGSALIQQESDEKQLDVLSPSKTIIEPPIPTPATAVRSVSQTGMFANTSSKESKLRLLNSNDIDCHGELLESKTTGL